MTTAAGTVSQDRRLLVAGGVVFVLVLGGLLLFLALGPTAQLTWVSPIGHLSIISLVAFGCVVAAVWVTVLGWKGAHPEIGLLGASLSAASLLALVHGLTAPGVLFGQNNAVDTSVFLSVPVALIVNFPILAPHTRVSITIAHHWRAWSVGWLGLVIALSALLLAAPDLLPPPPRPTHPLTLLVVGASLLGMLALAYRRIRIFLAGRSVAIVFVGAGLALLGLSTLIFLAPVAYSLAWWLAHAIDGVGVLTSTVGTIVAFRANKALGELLEPIARRDPRAAAELGLAVELRELVARLHHRPEGDADHLERVTELALRLAERAGLPPDRLRAVGVAALLHNFGRVVHPEADEFTRDQWGAKLLSGSPQLSPAADLIRWHHEQYRETHRGGGLIGFDRPADVDFVRVPDAWDVLIHTPMKDQRVSPEQARWLLVNENDGHWDPNVVRLLLAELDAGGGTPAEVSRAVSEQPACVDTLPAPLQHAIEGRSTAV